MGMKDILFDDFNSLLLTGAKTLFAYVVMIAFLRGVGKRTLTKMNAFDYIVTYALGSLLATISLNQEIPMLNGMAAMGLLLIFQYIVTWASSRKQGIRKWVTSSPRLIVYKGEVLEGALKEERLTEEELFISMRKNGVGSLDKVEMAVLESNGTISILSRPIEIQKVTMREVEGY